MNKKLLAIPRILIILYILMFVLLATDAGPLGFFIEAAPAILLIILLILFWRNASALGKSLMLFALFTLLFYHTYSGITPFVLITLPPLAIGYFLYSMRFLASS